MYDKSTSKVFFKALLSETFDITTGVLQGDVLAPFLFIIVIDYISRLSKNNFGYLTHKAEKVQGKSYCVTRIQTKMK